jgi:N-acyl homoserine lactone hydrolase
MFKSLLRPLLALSLLTFCGSAAAAAPPAPGSIKLYAMECGRVDLADLDFFADTDDYRGVAGKLVVPCFLIRHPKGDMIWDAGLPDGLSALPNGTDQGGPPGSRSRVPVTLRAQLKALGLDYADIKWFAFSHAHGDHVGNANALVNATWLVNRRERAWVEQTPAPLGADPSVVAGNKAAKSLIELDIDYDVFGDGSVRILQAPGHTPGHQMLLVTLPKAGPVLLSGDVYHLRASRAGRLVPRFNSSRAETLASIDKLERVIARTHARLVIEHDPEDFKALPKFPAFLN